MSKHDLVVVGAGPGGYIAAFRAAQLGMNVACIDKNAQLGGTCLRVGCIPSKAMLESSHKYYEASEGGLAAHGIKVAGVELDLGAMQARKTKVVDQLTSGVRGLFKKNGITVFQGLGTLRTANLVDVALEGGGTETLEASRILIATGSEPTSIPGVELDYDRIGTSTEALAYDRVPEHLIVIGGGVIGLELGSVWRRLGAKVTVLEYLPTFLPGVDEELSRAAQRSFKKQGLEIKLGVRVLKTERNGDRVVVSYEEKGATQTIEGDRVLVSTGRRPNTDGLGAQELGLAMDKRGVIQVDEHYRTNIPSVWAIGDVIPGPMLAHKAEEEGVATAEGMAGQPGHINYDAIPAIIYTHPEIATIGKTEQQLRDAGVPYRKGSFPYSANGRAKAMAETEGMVKILAHAETDRILGFHVFGAHASDLGAEGAVAIEFSASAEDLARSSHAHPTLSEIVKEAALATLGRALSI